MDNNQIIENNNNGEKIPKKRGRKKKEVPIDEKPKTEEKKKRGRKKKWETETTTKVIHHSPIIFNENLVDKTSEDIQPEKYDQEQVLFGNLNIKLHTNKDTVNYNSIKESLKQKRNGRINLTASDLESNSSNDTDEEKENENETENINIEFNKYAMNYEKFNESILNKISEENKVKVNKTKKNKIKINNDTKRYPVKSIKCMKFFSDEYDSGKEILLSNIRCYNCHHNFNTQPFFLPIDYCVSTKRYKVTGNFCSPNCAKSYALNSKTLCTKAYLVGEMYRKLFGQQELIKPAPPIQTLKEYGGTMSITDYRKAFHEQQSYNLLPVCSKIIYQDVIVK